jgi:rare lipoprotein A
MIRPLIVLILIAYAIAALGFGMAALGAECAGQIVWASFYGKETCNGRPPGHGKGFCETANGTAFDGSQMVVAHRTLPYGTMVRFTYRGKSVTVPVDDRGPYVRGRVFDLSEAAARRIGMIEAGVVKLCAERL